MTNTEVVPGLKLQGNNWGENKSVTNLEFGSLG